MTIRNDKTTFLNYFRGLEISKIQIFGCDLIGEMCPFQPKRKSLRSVVNFGLNSFEKKIFQKLKKQIDNCGFFQENGLFRVVYKWIFIKFIPRFDSGLV